MLWLLLFYEYDIDLIIRYIMDIWSVALIITAIIYIFDILVILLFYLIMCIVILSIINDWLFSISIYICIKILSFINYWYEY